MLKKTKLKRGEVNTTDAPSEASLLTEAQALGSHFERAPVKMMEVIEKARELLLARGDVPDLIARGYRVNDTMFERVKLIRGMLTPDANESAEPAEASTEMTKAASEMRARLMSIHGRLKRLGAAGGVDSGVFEIDSHNIPTVVSSMAAMISKLRGVQHLLPDQKQVEALVAEATALVETEQQSRSEAQVRSSKNREMVLQVAQLKRLIFDQIRHLSVQGLAAYPNDMVRELSYGLKRFARSKGSKSTSGPPSVEGVTE